MYQQDPVSAFDGDILFSTFLKTVVQGNIAETHGEPKPRF